MVSGLVPVTFINGSGIFPAGSKRTCSAGWYRAWDTDPEEKRSASRIVFCWCCECLLCILPDELNPEVMSSKEVALRDYEIGGGLFSEYVENCPELM